MRRQSERDAPSTDRHNGVVHRLLRVRFDKRDFTWLKFDGDDHEIRDDDETFLVAAWLLKDVTLANLRQTAGRILHNWRGEYDSADNRVVLYVPEDMHPDDFWFAVQEKANPPIECEIHAGSKRVVAHQYAVTPAEVDWDRVSEVAAAAAAQRGVSVSVSDAWQSATEAGWQVGVETARRGATVGDLIDACARVVAVVQATAAGLDRGTAADAIRAGYAEALVGARESAWLEAKSAPWDLTTEGGRIEASQDVARFANEAGGLIVVGATTKHRSDDEVIVRVGGIRPGLLSLRRLRMILDAHVYPPVDALDLAEVPLKGSGNVIVLISIPGQKEAAKPFIVHGAIVDGRVEGAFISIVRRRAEGSITIDPREIHAWLVAGRRLASGG